ncbi:hypothetical protein Tco_0321053 [Tanacetum coccineum]
MMKNPRRPGEIVKETYGNTTPNKQKLIDVEAEAVHKILNGIGNDIFSTVDACPNAKEMWVAIERLQQREYINIQDVKTKLFWEFGKFTSRDGESIKSYYTRFYKMMNEMVGNQLKDPVNTSLHTIDHEIGTRIEEVRLSCLERERGKRNEREKRIDILDILNN